MNDFSNNCEEILSNELLSFLTPVLAASKVCLYRFQLLYYVTVNKKMAKIRRIRKAWCSEITSIACNKIDAVVVFWEGTSRLNTCDEEHRSYPQKPRGRSN